MKLIKWNPLIGNNFSFQSNRKKIYSVNIAFHFAEELYL